MAFNGFAFGPFQLDTETGTLFRSGTPVSLSYRALQLLTVLVQKAGAVATKSELLEAVWPGMVIEEGNLTTQIALLRKALGTTPDGGDYILTIPRVGYRFAGPANSTSPSQVANAPSVEVGTGNPSIAVLPFLNLSPDPDQQFFADGLAEDIITRLSRLPWLFVAARNSSFTFRANTVDIKRVGQELSVRYVLSGSVRLSAERIRVHAQLSLAETGAQVWADRYELPLHDFFVLQDEIAVNVLAAIEPELYRAEHERFRSKPPQSLDAWGFVMRALPLLWTWASAEEIETAQGYLNAAITLDSSYARANSLLAVTHGAQAHNGQSNLEERLDLAKALALKGVQADPSDAWTHFAFGYVQMVSRQFVLAYESLNEALNITPSFALAHVIAGSACGYNGMGKEGLRHLSIASRLSPRDFSQAATLSTMGLCHLVENQYPEAVTLERRAVQLRPHFVTAWRTYAAAAGLAGDVSAARRALDESRRLQPSLSLEWVERYHPIVKSEHRSLYIEGLKRAGLS